MGNGASGRQELKPARTNTKASPTHAGTTHSSQQSPRRKPNGSAQVAQNNSGQNNDRLARQQKAVEHQERVANTHARQQVVADPRSGTSSGGAGGGGESLTHGATRHSGRQGGAGGSRRHGQAPPPANMQNLQPDQVVFETFTNKEGKEFICAYRAGKRYYLDSWHSQEWQPFPERWYQEGSLKQLDDNQLQENYNQQSTYQQGQSNQARPAAGSNPRDDREGFLKHPKRGRVETYLMEEKRYVHFFFDKFSGNWMRLPIGWELHHPLMQGMVRHVEEALPKWKDPADILAMLRLCNYNPDECIGTYLHLEGDEWLVPAKSIKSISEGETAVETLREKVKALEMELNSEKRQRVAAEKQLADLQDKFSKLSAEAGIAKTQVEAMQTSRPKTAAARPKTPAVSKKQAPAGPSVDQEQLEALTKSTQQLHQSHSRLRMAVTSQVDSMKSLISDTISAMREIKNFEAGSQQELEEIRALYQKEALQRRLLYNQLQELRGNIRVFCRPRRDDRCGNCLKFPSEQDIMVVNNDGTKKTFSFDKVYTTEASQEEDTCPIVTSCVDGYNVCLMAYGQTGSGKTFTMMGPDSNPGINIRAVTELLKVCKERDETKTYTLKVSMVEIYNETVQDLLTEDGKVLELHAVGNIIRIPDITEMPVETVKDVKAVMDMGDKNRSVAETKMNSTSSRSHLLLRINVQGTDRVSGAISNGVLTLCDLAGSERIGKTEAQGQRLVEAAAINKSLSALGQIFSALRTSQLHVPYRNSKLTQILRPCLGGDAKACLFVNVSPDVKNFAETCNTLDFGSNARQVALGQAKQNVKKAPGGP